MKHRKIVLTGGPCAGKTTMAQILSRAFHGSVVNVPESASLLFSGGFPRFPPLEGQQYSEEASIVRAADLIGQLGDPQRRRHVARRREIPARRG